MTNTENNNQPQKSNRGTSSNQISYEKTPPTTRLEIRVLHLTVNEDVEEQKLTTESMNLQAWRGLLFCASTPAAATLRILLCLAQIKSAFLNTPVQQGTAILVQPPPKCENDENILWLLREQLYGLRDSPKKFHQRLSTILRQLDLKQCLLPYTDNLMM
eukprot:6474479-Amphidinium_carterae.3